MSLVSFIFFTSYPVPTFFLSLLFFQGWLICSSPWPPAVGALDLGVFRRPHDLHRLGDEGSCLGRVGRGLASTAASWVGGAPAGSRTGATGEGDDLGTDFRKRSRNSPALSARNGDSKRGRTEPTMPRTSSLPASPSGSFSCLDSQPRADSSPIAAPDLLWVRDCSSEPIVYPDLSDGPFIVLMESTFPGRNLGRYDPLTIALYY